eukprot:ANDGO_07356.mRNA.1 Protein white
MAATNDEHKSDHHSSGGGVPHDDDDGLTLHWHNVRFAVQTSATLNPSASSEKVSANAGSGGSNASESRKHILRGLSGVVEPGETLALLGTSGAGKSTLLNLLSSRNMSTGANQKSWVSGSVNLSHHSPSETPKLMSALCAYVLQHDLLLANLTVDELLGFTARLRGISDNPAIIRKKVDDVVDELDLEKCRSTFTSNLSGGQKKRVAVAQELLAPSVRVLMLDEPTSGLDSYAAMKLCLLLKKRAMVKKHPVVCTIHQPAWELLEKSFDKVCILAEGRCIYFGKVADAVNYFTEIGYKVPPFANPADYWLQLVKQVPAKDLADAWDASLLKKQQFGDSEWFPEFEKVSQKEVPSYAANAEGKGEENGSRNEGESENALQITTARKREEATANQLVAEAKAYRPSLIAESILLTKRSFLMGSREPMVFRAKVAQLIIMGLIIGLIFFQLGTDQNGVQNRTGAMFMLVTNVAFGSITTVIMTFPKEKPIMLREHAAGLVHTLPYFLSKTLAEIPFQLLSPLLLQVVSYFLIGFQPEAWIFFTILGFFELAGFAATATGFCVSALSPNGDVANAVLPIVMIPAMIFGGLFVNLDDIPPWFVWLKYFSFVMYAFDGSFRAEMSDMTFHCNPGQYVKGVCPVTTGSQAVARLKFEFDSTQSVGILVGLVVGFRLLAFFALWYAVDGKKTSGALIQDDEQHMEDDEKLEFARLSAAKDPSKSLSAAPSGGEFAL